MSQKDYSYIQPKYKFPVSDIECVGYHYTRRDKPTLTNPQGQLRHYVIVKCPICNNEFEGRLDRLEFNPKNQKGPRTLYCKKCSLTHKRPFEDPWRASENNNAEKQGINITHTENLEGKIFNDLTIGPAKDGYTDKFGLAWWPCKCRCGNFEFVRGNTLTSTKRKLACKKCLGSISSGERAIIDWLKQYNIQYNTQVIFDNLRGIGEGLLRFDIGIKNNNNNFIYLIEFQGLQHYQPIEYFGGEEQFKIQQEHDNRKRQWCKENNIKLIEIPYNYNNLEEYLSQLL